MAPSTEHHTESLRVQPKEAEEEALLGFAMKLTCTSAVSMVLKAMIELDVLEIMAAGGPGARLTPAEISSKIPTTNPHAAEVLDRMLRFLATYGVVECEVWDEGRKYGLAPVCKFLTKNEDGVSAATLVLMNQHKVTVASWLELKAAVLEGAIPFVKAHGISAFEYHGTDPEFSDIFNRCMFGQTTILMKKVLDKYNGFEGLEVLVDVGGGLAATLRMIVAKYPTIKAINFDLPYVVSEAPSIPGVEHVGGDMFVDIPRGDAIFMKWILHDWSDEHCVKLLKNCWKALPDNGKVIVVEGVVPETPEKTDAARNIAFGDLCMLAYNVGGKERTEKEYRQLAKESGFSEFKAACYVYGFWVMEFHK